MVAKITPPQVISGAFASQSDNKNVIPNAPTGTYNASMADGFPNVTMIPKALGGTPPDGADFNGILNLVTQFYYQFQNGYQPTFIQDVSDAIGGYPVGAVLLYTDTNGQSKPVVSLIENNTYNFVTNPEYIDGVHWAIAWSTNYLMREVLPEATAFTTVDLSAPGAAIKELTIPDSLSTLAINLTIPTTAPSGTFTYELHITVGAVIPFITWSLSDGSNITWLTDSLQQPEITDKTAIFVFRWQNGKMIGNYGGAY